MKERILSSLTPKEVEFLQSSDGLYIPLEIRRFRNINRLNDALFKFLFAREANKAALISFLNSILDDSRQIVDLHYTDRELSPVGGRKAPRFDVRAEDASGKIFHVEVQTSHGSGFFQRCAFYAALSYTDQVRAGDAYEAVLCPVVLVALMDFNCFKNNDQVYSWYRQTNVRTGEPAPETMEFHMFELPKLENSKDKIALKLWRWLRYLTSTNDADNPEIRELTKEDPAMEQTLTFEKEFFMTPSERYRYLRNEADRKFDTFNERSLIAKATAEGEAKGEAKGMAKGMAKGKAEGIAEGQLKMARNLLTLGLSPEMIMKASGLSSADLESLISEKRQ